MLSALFMLLIIQTSFGYETFARLMAKHKSKDFLFDLDNSNPVLNGNNTIRQATVAQMPSLAYMGISFALFEFAPCGINLPHIHPRASELIYVSLKQNLNHSSHFISD